MKHNSIKYLIENACEFMTVADLQQSFTRELFNKVCAKFQFENLPQTINEDYLKLQLIVGGHCLIINYKDNLYVIESGQGTDLNYAYLPQITPFANPYLTDGYAKINSDNADSVMIYTSSSDKYLAYGGGGVLWEYIKKTAWLLANTITSINTMLINTRLQQVFIAPTDTDVNSAETVLKKLFLGEPYFIIKDMSLLDNIKMIPTNASQNRQLIDLIETYQYIYSMFYHSIGINSNFNMKRERMNEAEILTNDDSLRLNFANIVENVEKGVEEVNKLFNTNIVFKVVENNVSQPERLDNESTNNSDDISKRDTI